MARRRDSLLENLILLPWWVGLLIGAVGFAAIAFVIPAYLASGSSLFANLGPSLRPLAWIWFGLCAFAASVSALRLFLIGRRFDLGLKSASDVQDLSWSQFEVMVSEAFRRQGFFVYENGGGGADGGIDIVLRKDGKKFYVQCKQWKVFKVGVKPVRELLGVITANGADGGFVVTSGRFTKEAKDFAANTGITLIDGEALGRLVEELRRSSQPHRKAAEEPTPNCPRCGMPMMVRTARRGRNIGREFWGCSGYPRCKGTLELQI
jgi:restriction system protein